MLDDSDITAYQAALRHQNDTDWGDGLVTRTVDLKAAIKSAVQAIEENAERIDADRIIVCISDKENFRKEVLPTYKGNRDPAAKPELLSAVKEYLAENYECYIRPTLEADDVMGILSTGNKIKGEKVIVSIDKDMQTIPGLLYNPGKPDLGIRNVSVEEADFFFFKQTLMGDTTDGYKGCPSIGEARANKILIEADDYWEAIVSTYESKGLTTEDALQQARVARILRVTDYDFKKKRVKLWTP